MQGIARAAREALFLAAVVLLLFALCGIATAAEWEPRHLVERRLDAWKRALEWSVRRFAG